MPAPDVVADAALGVPAAPLRPLVTRYAGYRYLGFPPGVHLGLPSRSLTLVIALGPPTYLATMPDPTAPPVAFDALAGGLHTGAVGIGHDGDQFGVQLDLTPFGARALLGVPAGELARQVVDLSDLLGTDAERLRCRVAEAPGWPERFAVLDEVLLRRATAFRVPPAPQPLRRAWDLLVASRGSVRVDTLAEQVGWSRRHLTERFTAEYGLTPKEVGRVVRFECSVRRLRRARPDTLAVVAAACGYYDQAHLAREWVSLAGCPPSAWLAGEELPFVQDTGADDGQAAVS